MTGGWAVTKVDLPYLMRQRDRKGRWRYYYRQRGLPKVRVIGTPGTPEFLDSYQEARKAAGNCPEIPDSSNAKPVRGTWRWLCEAYLASPEFKELERSTKRPRELVLMSTWTEPRAPGAAEQMGSCPLGFFTDQAVRWLRNCKQETPTAANTRVKAIRAVFAWAIETRAFSGANPARDIPGLRPKNPSGHHTWTVKEVRQYERRHPIGTKARLALAIFMFTGARRSDAVALGRPNVTDGEICWTEFKGRNREPKERTIPMLPELQAVLEATPLTGLGTWLVTQYGLPFTVAGFGNWFRDRCNEAGLPHCSAHGLRKAGATIAAENGATAHQLQAIFGWETLKQVEKYTRKARAKKLAGEAMHLLVSKE